MYVVRTTKKVYDLFVSGPEIDSKGWRQNDLGFKKAVKFDSLADAIRALRAKYGSEWSVYKVTYGLVWYMNDKRDSLQPYCQSDQPVMWTEDRALAKRWPTKSAALVARGTEWGPDKTGAEARVVRFMRRVA